MVVARLRAGSCGTVGVGRGQPGGPAGDTEPEEVAALVAAAAVVDVDVGVACMEVASTAGQEREQNLKQTLG